MTLPNDHDHESSAVVLERLAADYFGRRRAGEDVSIASFAAEHPSYAERIEACFPALELLEQVDLSPTNADDATAVRTPAGVIAGSAPALERLGNYRIVREVGRGGMGIVFEAVEEKLGRRVAVKVLPPQFQLDQALLERFDREAKAAAALQHPNIVPVYGLGEDNGVQFFAMQFIDGVTLDETIARIAEWKAHDETGGAMLPPITDVMRQERERKATPTPTSGAALSDSTGSAGDGSTSSRGNTAFYRSAARTVLAAADATAYAHARGVIHRDLKPSNLMVDTEGKIWVTDFGLAKTEDGGDLTLSGDVLGTVRYMAPERFEGQSIAAGDTYALGLILYELLVQRPAFDAKSQAALMRKIAAGDVKKPRAIDPTVPVDLETIAMKAIDTVPSARYESPAAMAADLRSYLEARPITARPPTIAYLLRLAIRRHRALAFTVMASVVLLVAATIYYVHGLSTALDNAETARQNEAAERRKATDAKERAERSEALEVEQRANAEFQAASANIMAGYVATERGDANLARKHLEQVPGEHRRFVWRYLSARADDSIASFEVTRIHGGGYDPRGWARFHPDGRRVLAIAANVVGLWDLETGELIARNGNRRRLEWCKFAWGPKGRWFAVYSKDEKQLQLWTVSPLRCFRRFPASCHQIAVSPDGRRIALGGVGRVKILAPSEGRVIHDWEVGDYRLYGLSFTPDGRSLFVSGGPHVKRVDMATGQVETLLEGHGFGRLDSSSDGTKFAVINSRETVCVYDLRERAIVAQIAGRKSLDIAFDRSGRRIALACFDGVIRVFDWTRSGGFEATRLFRGHTHRPCSVDFHPDGERLVSCGYDHHARVWDLRVIPSFQRVKVASAQVRWIDVNPEGTLLASYSADGFIRVFDSETLEPVGAWPRASHFAFTPEGDLITNDACVRDALTFEVKRKIEGPGGIRVFSPAQDLCAQWRKGGELVIRAWPSGEVRFRDKVGAGRCAFSQDGSKVVIARKTRIMMVDLANGAVSTLGRHEATVKGAVFFANDTRVASAGEDYVIRVWDVAERKQVAVLPPHDARVERIITSPDHERLVTVTRRGDIKFWDAQRLLEIASIRPYEMWIRTVRFSPDGSRLYAGYANGAIGVLSTTSMAKRAERARRDRAVLPAATELADRLLAEAGGDPDAALASLAGREADATIRAAATRRIRAMRGSPEAIMAMHFRIVQTSGLSPAAYRNSGMRIGRIAGAGRSLEYSSIKHASRYRLGVMEADELGRALTPGAVAPRYEQLWYATDVLYAASKKRDFGRPLAELQRSLKEHGPKLLPAFLREIETAAGVSLAQ